MNQAVVFPFATGSTVYVVQRFQGIGSERCKSCGHFPPISEAHVQKAKIVSWTINVFGELSAEVDLENATSPRHRIALGSIIGMYARKRDAERACARYNREQHR